MKNIKMLAIAALLVAVAVTSYSVSGTYAKYTSTYTNSDSARVAKWAFTVNDKSMTSEVFTFDLFKTILDSDVNATETDVAEGKIIAPGTSGKFDIKLANDSEVNATYLIDYTVTNEAHIALEFSADGQNWTNELADVASTDINMDGEAEHSVYWRWVYERGTQDAEKDINNAADTSLGLEGDDTVTVAAKIVVTQKD